MSMFDYDARPVTPVPVLVGTAASRDGYAIRDFLSRNGYPFEWVDAGQPEAVRAVLGTAEVEPSALPLCILPDGSRLASATVEQVAAGLGMVVAPSRSEYDLMIVGAGPAGLGRCRQCGIGGPAHRRGRGGGARRPSRDHFDDREPRWECRAPGPRPGRRPHPGGSGPPLRCRPGPGRTPPRPGRAERRTRAGRRPRAPSAG